jgi:hypothetical protein
VYLIQILKVSELLLSVAPDVEALVSSVLIKIDALLTLTELSRWLIKTVLQFSTSVVSISITYRFLRQITGLARFVHIRGSRIGSK